MVALAITQGVQMALTCAVWKSGIMQSTRSVRRISMS